MTHGSLFSGVGGFDLAASWLNWDNVFQVENDKFCQKVLAKNFPNVKRYGDIKEFDGTEYRGLIDIISGGPPCQPTSNAGKRKGEKDDRWLWPEAIRILGEIMPKYGIFENPDDLLSLDNGRSFERICSQMEDLGYRVRTIGIASCFVGTWHKRDRVWIIADIMHNANKRKLANRKDKTEATGSKKNDKQERKTLYRERIRIKFKPGIKVASDINSEFLSGTTQRKFRSISETIEPFTGRSINGTSSEIGLYWETEPGVVRMVHGVPHRMDRIKALGNAIVPQVAFQIFKAIEEYSRN